LGPEAEVFPTLERNRLATAFAHSRDAAVGAGGLVEALALAGALGEVPSGAVQRRTLLLLVMVEQPLGGIRIARSSPSSSDKEEQKRERGDRRPSPRTPPPLLAAVKTKSRAGLPHTVTVNDRCMMMTVIVTVNPAIGPDVESGPGARCT
jgi:hypothetical protein